MSTSTYLRDSNDLIYNISRLVFSLNDFERNKKYPLMDSNDLHLLPLVYTIRVAHHSTDPNDSILIELHPTVHFSKTGVVLVKILLLNLKAKREPYISLADAEESCTSNGTEGQQSKQQNYLS